MKQHVVFGALMTGVVLASQPALPHAQATTTVQFDREIVRILDDHCVMCHMEKGPAFPLVTYEQTYAARWKIRQDALSRHMAPWAAVSGYGDFANDNGLTQREIDFLVSWAESFGPRNNGEVYRGLAAQATKSIQARTDFERWELGKPDLVMTPAGAIVDPKLKSDRWLRAFEYKPADRRAVRAVWFTIQESGQWIGSWTPWQGVVSFPDGLAVRLPAGSHLVARVYSGSKESVVDQGSLGLYYADKPSSRAVTNFVLDAKPLKLAQDTNVLALEPALQPGIQSIEVSAKMPTGATQVLLFAKDIPIDWPTPYVYRRAVSLPKGTELRVVAHGAVAPVTFSAYPGTPLAAEQPKGPPAPATTRRFELTGTVRSVDAANGQLVVEHSDIPGLMGAMTMAYRVGQRENLQAISAGDQIRSDVVVSETGSRLENIQIIQRKK